MCLLIAQVIGADPVSDARLRQGWKANKDGAGYAFVADGKLVVCRPFFKFKPFLAAYKAHHAKYGQSSPFLVHFRFTTHGGVSASNTHPFTLAGGKVALGHNGMMHEFESPHKDESDTAFFCRSVLAHRDAEQLMSPKFNKWLEVLIGDSNKLVLIDDTCALSIVNEEAGHWDSDTWYSNNSYMSQKDWHNMDWRAYARARWERDVADADLDRLSEKDWLERCWEAESAD